MCWIGGQFQRSGRDQILPPFDHLHVDYPPTHFLFRLLLLLIGESTQALCGRASNVTAVILRAVGSGIWHTFHPLLWFFRFRYLLDGGVALHARTVSSLPLVGPGHTYSRSTDSGLTLDAMIILLTAKLIPFFLILWIVSKYLRSIPTQATELMRLSCSTVNVSVASYPLELLPGIFRYGYFMPFYNLSRTVLAVSFGTKNESKPLIYPFPAGSCDIDYLLPLFPSWPERWRPNRLDRRQHRNDHPLFDVRQ